MAAVSMPSSCFNHRIATLLVCAFVLATALLPLPAVCRRVPTSPLTDEKAEELVHDKLQAAAAALEEGTPLLHELQESRIAPSQAKDSWKLRALWVSVTGKEPRGTRSRAIAQADDLSHAAAAIEMSPSETIVEEARQVPGGPDPLHHSNQPSSP